MSEEEEVYFCEDCERTMPLAKGTSICCGHEMKRVPLSSCRKSQSDAEQARFGDADDACDDGR